MPKIQSSSPELNRLRAAAGLLPLIETALADDRIGREKAALMAEFCAWATTHDRQDDPEADRLAKVIADGLERVRTLLA